MQTKLTLRLESEIIEAAKRYAAARGTSVSKLVAGYLDALTRSDEPQSDDDWQNNLSPITRKLIGLGKTESNATQPDESDYRLYIEEKHSRHLNG